VKLVATLKGAELTEVTNWLFSQKKAMAQVDGYYGRYLATINRAQALLAQNMPDPPWSQSGKFYVEFSGELIRIADELGALHLAICDQPLPDKAPFDQLQTFMLQWAVDYARNMNTLATRFHEKAALPYEKTGIGEIQFTLTGPTFSQFLAVYQAQLKS
jgi:hypothetical protein